MKKAFTLVELLVVVGIISLLLALGLPVMTRVREAGWETVCRSNLRQMGMVLKSYTNTNDNAFPEAAFIYHSPLSFYPPPAEWALYHRCCRWHDARIGLDSELLRHDHPELRGSLWPYVKDMRIARCRVGMRANAEKGCHNFCDEPDHGAPPIAMAPQYTTVINGYLGSEITTAIPKPGALDGSMDFHTRRRTWVRKETHVTRNPSQVFAFAEENSWRTANPISDRHHREPVSVRGAGEQTAYDATSFPTMDILSSFVLNADKTVRDRFRIGDGFATYHRPRKGDLDTGYSYVVMLDGHTEKVAVDDQLRKSRRPPDTGESRLGPGGNLALAWPLDIPPLGGWENQ
jgi:prepilin-type N-terminal cleavage/methylation domain-containing protein